MIKNKKWQEIIDAPIGHIFKNWFEDGIRCLITKGLFCLNAFIGIPKNHLLAGFECDDLLLNVHGGLNFSKCFLDQEWSKDFYWYGWHYGHSNDKSFLSSINDHVDAKIWTVEMIEKEIKQAVIDFKKLASFLERLVLKHEKFLMEKINDEFVKYLSKQYQHQKASLEYDAPGSQNEFKDGLIFAYKEVYAKIMEIKNKVNSCIHDD